MNILTNSHKANATLLAQIVLTFVYVHQLTHQSGRKHSNSSYTHIIWYFDFVQGMN